MLIIHVIRDMQIPFDIKEIPELESKRFESFSDAREDIMRKIAESVLRKAKEKAESGYASRLKNWACRPGYGIQPTSCTTCKFRDREVVRY